MSRQITDYAQSAAQHEYMERNRGNTRTVLYVVALQAASKMIHEYIRLRGTDRMQDAIRAARAKHSKFYPAQVVSMRVMD